MILEEFQPTAHMNPFQTAPMSLVLSVRIPYANVPDFFKTS
ncbi:putative protein OS=Eoetvoesiella caeni OX=645616 GN=DFR37_12618 PE=4 SV=1 [Eoetvoesiella caeni]|uniref:Uncharacterized protein n=1 Tax=Eoetvoesiella caeni TaxID=645616 RepID=A0A366GY22_9BURK|nr:hypothetical protein DFR37_12618 [Eoetvoesiella caeni]